MRVTSTTATLIDHILTNDLDDIQGILCTSISDHTQTEMPLFKRNMRQSNILEFISEINRVDWQFVLTETDTQLAYSKCHEAMQIKYNVFFPYRKIYERHYKNKPWLSAALK